VVVAEEHQRLHLNILVINLIGHVIKILVGHIFLSSCQSACVEPPCMINYFEFLQTRAWVGYPITGTWSASDWCEDCDVTCTPYPECVWKQDSIGIGSDEYKFELEESGDYTYTLTCYKQGGADQRQATITLEALNLPWWREIIPVLPGSLFSLWP